MKLWPLLLSLICLAGMPACKKKSDSNTPSITFISLSPDSVRSGSNKDTTFLVFGFKDGDGDLGNDPSKGRYDVFLKDSRDTIFPITRLFFPPIPDDARDPINGLEGRGVIALRALNITTRQDTLHKLHGDTLTYKMWVIDQADHTSDTITTTPLYILPQ